VPGAALPTTGKEGTMGSSIFSQEGRLLEIKTTLGLTELLLEKLSGEETLSKPFEFKVLMLSPDSEVDIKSLLRTNATISLHLADGTRRYFNAVFRSIAQATESGGKAGATGASDSASNLAVYEAILVPKVWFLSLNSDCKIFQTMTVPDIVGKVLKDAGVSDYSFRTQGTYPVRDYCVQYRESSLNFISRLLEEEGIFYFFEHTDTKHTMVFADKSSMLGTCPGQAAAAYAYDQDGWVDKDEGLEGVATLERIETAFTGKSALTDYNFETPSLNLLGSLGRNNEEAFDYPGEYTEKEDGSRYTRLRLEELEALQFVVNGTSRCRAFRAGCNFRLKKHFRTDTNKDYFLTSVTHQAQDSTYRHNEEAAHYYNNSFVAIPKTVPYRPPRVTGRPTVQGLQPALVVGQAGEEIWVDKYGRIKVQFYWDRLGKKNETSSCWCRVSQIWAGKNWGWMTIPRIGQEVLVDFLEGDPDRPVVVGRVYNADQMPPYTLPGNQTQSGIKSRSSKGGGTDNYNEIRFEDLKGSELVTVHAEKDMDTSVEHDDNQLVQNNRTIEVDGTHTEKIVKDTAITITQGNHSLTINQGNQSITLNQGNQSTQLDMGNQSIKLSMGNQTTKVDMGAVSTTAMQSITLTVGGSSIKIDPMGVTIKGMMIQITADTMAEVQGEAMLTLKGGITMIN
jgi:type VI secretion system secreted protein VgrG